MDLAYENDASGKRHGWMVMVDEGTDWMVAKYLDTGKSAKALFSQFENGWIDWAGPPDVLVSDMERGITAEEFVGLCAKAGTLYVPTAAYAPWQHGQVERKIQSFKNFVPHLNKFSLHLNSPPPICPNYPMWKLFDSLHTHFIYLYYIFEYIVIYVLYYICVY